MDVLSDAITAMRTGRPHASRTALAAPWGLRFAGSGGAGFHIVRSGTAVLMPSHGADNARTLGTGDVAFMPHGHGHVIADAAGSPRTEVVPLPGGGWGRLGSAGDRGTGPETLLLCGAYQLDRTMSHPLLAGLPETVHLPAGTDPGLTAAVDLLAAELDSPAPGGSALIPALLDTLLIYIVRAWLHTDAGRTATGWSAALADPALAAALHALHDDPARPWTVRELATVAGLSRAVFAQRFTAVVGQPPLTYLTWWRMIVARRLLRTGDAPLRVVAARSGYLSEFAFAKAFKREVGLAPGAYRRAAA